MSFFKTFEYFVHCHCAKTTEKIVKLKCDVIDSFDFIQNILYSNYELRKKNRPRTRAREKDSEKCLRVVLFGCAKCDRNFARLLAKRPKFFILILFLCTFFRKKKKNHSHTV